MSQYLRLFQSAVDPADVEEVKRLFLDDVKPAFSSLEGCLSIELVINTEKNAGGLVDGAAISRWDSMQAMNEALASHGVNEALVRVMPFLRQEPLSRVLEIVA